MHWLDLAVGYLIKYGYPIVLVGVMIEDAGIPIPGETTLLVAGFLAFQGHLNVFVVIALGIVGAILGDNIGYVLGKKLGRPFLERYGRFVFINDHKLALADRFFARHGDKTVFFARFVSGLRELAAWFAGISRMHWRTFFTYNASGAVAWAVAITMTGYAGGYFLNGGWRLLVVWVGRGSMLVLGFAVLIALIVVAIRYSHRVKEEIEEHLPKVLGLRELVLLSLEVLSVALFLKIAQDVAAHESFSIDRTVSLVVHSYAAPWLTHVMRGFTTMGSWMAITAVIIGLGVWFWIKSERRAAVMLALSGILSSLLDLILKVSFHRARPDFSWSPILHSYSFPSGHTTTATAVYGAAAYFLARRYPRLRWPLGIITTILLLGIGLSRVYLGAHWATDVIGGFAAGGLTAFALVYWYDKDYRIFSLVKAWLRKKLKKRRQTHAS